MCQLSNYYVPDIQTWLPNHGCVLKYIKMLHTDSVVNKLPKFNQAW